MNNNFYTYRHIRLDTNTPFYVGKGHGKRAYSTKSRNPYWHNIADKYGYEVEIMMEDLEEKVAFAKEKEFIKLYRSLGYCEANMTEGGEGLSNPSKEIREKISNTLMGHVVSQITRKKISLKATEQHLAGYNCTGRKHTEETKEKNRLSHTGKKQSKETIEKRVSKFRGKPSPLKGRKQPKTSITMKGHVPWNKGKTKETDERIKRESLSRKGKPSPKKGKKYSKKELKGD